MPHESPDTDARRQLKQDLARFHCAISQPDAPPLFTASPESAMQTVHWRWRDLEPLLERIGRELALDPGGARRTLRLANPGLPYGTTPTFWASIQVILPGEIAGAHRHTANAFRFIMKGSGATTTVDGDRYTMNEGDLVLTPGMMWHDHAYDGDTPMIWLDVLDISLVRAMHATFFEPAATLQQAAAPESGRAYRAFGSGIMSPPDARPLATNPLLAYPRRQAMAALAQAEGLAADPFDDVILEYRNPTNGGPAMHTMGMRLQTLRPGIRTQARRHTGSKLYYVVEGEGSTTVDGVEYAWSAGDFLAVRPWAWHSHANTGDRAALLFQVNDIPALRALGYYREETAAPAQP